MSVASTLSSLSLSPYSLYHRLSIFLLFHSPSRFCTPVGCISVHDPKLLRRPLVLSFSRECMSHEERDRRNRAKLTVPCCLLRCLTCFHLPLSVRPRVPRGGGAFQQQTRRLLFATALLYPCSLCMTMLLEGRDGEGRRRVSRDRPRCPVLHCRSPVWRRPTHRRHHV